MLNWGKTKPSPKGNLKKFSINALYYRTAIRQGLTGYRIQPEAPTITCTAPTSSTLYDQHFNPVVARWLEDSTWAFNDAYARTELIQWVWRSSVRRGEEITLYLPSPRMRELGS